MAGSVDRVRRMSFASVYPLYVAKAERKGRTAAEVDELITWLTGYDEAGISAVIEDEVNFEAFFAQAPAPNPARSRVTGVICGVRIEEIEDPIMREVRILDKLIDELARGRSMDRIQRSDADRA